MYGVQCISFVVVSDSVNFLSVCMGTHKSDGKFVSTPTFHVYRHEYMHTATDTCNLFMHVVCSVIKVCVSFYLEHTH